ncbi:TVP38/TMEM64 family protein [Fundidesulfovibrio soli]|uniref:TVP38/TMEM64 family protein n=1 Tax=Fundidesulfovibrio soli TaxID=2922716 RepID=UPI001FAF5427|nr:VTT domain-containing protein [Fundidesulfovibrio soli]
MKKVALILAGVALLALIVLWYAHASEVLDLARQWAMASHGFVREHFYASWLGMLLFCTLIINLPIPVAALLKLMSGFIFGVQAGFALNVAASVSGGLFGFVLARHFFHRAFHRRFGHQLARIDLEVARNGFWYVLCSRLVIATPFFMVNVLAGLSCLRKRKFLLGTFLGVLPSSMIYAVSGSKLLELASAEQAVDPRIVAVLAGAGLLVVIPALINRHRKKHRA